MEKSVVAVCPGCSAQLRIPAEWADKAVKCKKCGSVVRAQGSAPSPALPAAAPYVPAPVAPPPTLVFDPSTGTYQPAPAHPYTPPAYGYPAAPPGYAYPAAPGYPPPGYPYPMPPGYPPQAPAPQPARAPANDFGSLDDKRPRSRKKSYKKSSGAGLLYAFFGFALLVVIAGGAAVFVFKDRLLGIAAIKPSSTEIEKPKETNPGNGTPFRSGAMPRRMLAISVTKYLYANPLIGGKNKSGGSEFNEAIKGIAFRYEVPDSAGNNQLFVLTDAEGKLMQSAGRGPLLKDSLADAIGKFCTTSRGQDRVVIYFGGHAVAKDGKAYLVPAEGDPSEPESLLPLEEVWAKLKACPAQQKVVIFDVCRLSTDDNAVRPGSEPMTEELETLLHSPPPGVQVLTSCSKGQTASEFRSALDAETPQGSAFLGALRSIARKSKAKPGSNDPFPVSQWAEDTKKRLADALGPNRASVPKVSGSEGPAVEPKSEDPAQRFVFAPPPPGAAFKDVQTAFALLATPPLLGGGDSDSIESSVFFREENLKDYKADDSYDDVLKAGEKLPLEISKIKPAQWKEFKQPWRLASVKALEEVRTKWKKLSDPEKDSVLKDGLGGVVNDALKKAIEKEQIPISDMCLDLSDTVDELKKFQADAEKDPSPFWKATFRFAYAQANMRLAFAHEANLALGNVRTDSLPEGGDKGLRLVQVAKMKNRKEAPLGKAAQEQFEVIAKEHKGTPWEVLAKQWRSISLGLEWRAKPADADTTMAMEGK